MSPRIAMYKAAPHRAWGRRLRALAALALLAPLAAAQAQGNGPAAPLATRGLPYAPLGADMASDTVPPPLPREFRAVWVATVANIDWPSKPGLPVAQQKAELLAILDRAALLRLNAIIFQVRPGGDALYASKLEPWSYFLTGRMGRAPEPFYDPLAFAIEEAHRRGLELHAWFNPYRARHPGDTTRVVPASHISRSNPAVVKKYGVFQWMDPGEPAVRRRTTQVILDVVNRYDVDGVHIDDYFYPYPVRAPRGGELPFPDATSYQRYRDGGGKLGRDDWRRRNVDLLVEDLYTQIKKSKPWVKFGISPFGIWRPGYPEVVRGLDAYAKLYADSRRWLNEGWLDYWTPQLYWRSDAPAQPYAPLLEWWRGQNTKERHVWPGNFTSRATSRGRTIWPVTEIFQQIGETRAQLGASSGNVHFSMEGLMADRDSIVSRLVAGPYAEPALVPPSPWLGRTPPPAPVVSTRVSPTGLRVDIRPSSATNGGPAENEALWWVVRARYGDSWRAVVLHASERRLELIPGMYGELPQGVWVTAVGRAGAGEG